MLSRPGLTRCKNLTVFLCVAGYCFPSLVQFDVFVSFVLRLL